MLPDWQAVAKVDYQINANHTVFGRYLHSDSSAKAAWPRTSNILTTAVRGRPKTSSAKSLTLGDTLVFGSNMVNSFRAAYNPTHVTIDLAPFLDASSVGSKVYTYIPGQIVLDVTSAFSVGTVAYPCPRMPFGFMGGTVARYGRTPRPRAVPIIVRSAAIAGGTAVGSP